MNINQKSKFLALILRHKPEAGNITLDKNGWASVDELIKNAKFTREELDACINVKPGEKVRYKYNEDRTKVQAMQGHSVTNATPELTKDTPRHVLYHGTKEQFLEDIMKNGLDKMNRQHVHLSADTKTAREVADRRSGKTVILEIDVFQMVARDFKFYKAENGVWLTDHVPPRYLSVIK